MSASSFAAHRDWELPVLCLAGLAARLAAFAAYPGILHADEIFQYAEQAHRVVFGEGMVPWEYEYGLRSWLVPGVLLGVTWLRSVLAAGPIFLHWAIAVQMSLLGLLPVIAAFIMAHRTGGRRAAVFAALLNALCFESVLTSSHMLADTLAADLLPVAVAAAALARTNRHHVLAGLAWGAVLAVRLPLLPAVGVGILLSTRVALAPVLRQCAGVLCVAVVYGAIDALTLGRPFGSLITFLSWNIGHDAAASFGVLPWYTYLTSFIGDWSIGLPLLAIGFGAGLRRAPVAAAVAISVVASLSLIPHKEIRFIYPATPLLLSVAGIGTAALLDRWKRLGLAPAVTAVLWTGVFLGIAFTPRMIYRAARGTAAIQAAHAAAADGDLCGLGILPASATPLIAGHAHLRPGTRLYPATPETAPAFNRMLTIAGGSLPGFATTGCWNEPNPGGGRTICLLKRAGSCTPGAAPLLRLPDLPFLPALGP